MTREQLAEIKSRAERYISYVRKDLALCGGHQMEILTLNHVESDFRALLAHVEELEKMMENCCGHCDCPEPHQRGKYGLLEKVKPGPGDQTQ